MTTPTDDDLFTKHPLPWAATKWGDYEGVGDANGAWVCPLPLHIGRVIIPIINVAGITELNTVAKSITEKLEPLSVEFADDDGDILSFRLPTDESDVCFVDMNSPDDRLVLDLTKARQLRDWLTAWLRKEGKDD